MPETTQVNTTLQKFDITASRVYGLHLPIPPETAEEFIDGNNRRIKCTFQNGAVHLTGLMPYKEYWYILMNEALAKRTGLELGQSATIILEKDTSPYGMIMPEELQILLDQDETGNVHFQNLTPGKQRNLIYIVNKVKNPDSRLNKAVAIVDHLNNQNGQLDFKLLTQKIKDYNQRVNLK